MFDVLFLFIVFLCARRHRAGSSEQPVGANQEQVFKEEPQCLSKESKWTSPSVYSSLS
jgi:hypothetical protein